MIRRFSSRRERLQHVFLRERLREARSYLRIAGYFRSSLFELLEEQELDALDELRIVCNSDLDPRDLSVARSAREQGLALKDKWNEQSPKADVALNQKKYQRLHELLASEKLKVRVVSRDTAPFLHGKAGIIESRTGARTSFIGSLNETREGWSQHYELLWEDDSPEAVSWVREEFDYLWAQGIDLPRVVLDEIERNARRVEYPSVEAVPPHELPPAAMAEAPLYQRGEALQVWQQAFVGMFLQHRETYGKARLLLADEVGVGKTLSLAVSAVVASLLGDGPALILCPATLTQQWQIELWDKLGVPSAVWTRDKTWLDHTGHEIRTSGPQDVARCPYQIGIVSTGLLFQSRSPERKALLEKRGGYGTVILDEAHRARRSALLGQRGDPNNLLNFMTQIARETRHVLLGSGTPIQTDVSELWDLLDILGQGAEFVLGKPFSLWRDPEKVLPLITGAEAVDDEAEAWDLMRNPLPPASELALYDHVRADLRIPARDFYTSKSAVELDSDFTRAELMDAVEGKEAGLSFFQRHNPIVRHTVLRRRADLELRGLLPKIAVDIHPQAGRAGVLFKDQALLTNSHLEAAMRSAEKFAELLSHRTNAGGFLKSGILQRICSSIASGIATSKMLLQRGMLADSDLFADQQLDERLTPDERLIVEEMLAELQARPDDPKLEAVVEYLTGPRDWLGLGCIIFSQYFDTAEWIARMLAARLPQEPIALYAGAGKSGIFLDGRFTTVNRDAIKDSVKSRKLRLLVATDAACEGLNLQTLGTLINIDLPWNPSRLEQRLGRIKRLGQTRQSVDMLNLVYAGTRDETVYARLSQRMRDRFDIFGSLPDVIEDDWIDDIEHLDQKLAEFITKRNLARSGFDLRYGETIDPRGEPWEKCSKVLSRKDLEAALSKGW